MCLALCWMIYRHDPLYSSQQPFGAGITIITILLWGAWDIGKLIQLATGGLRLEVASYFCLDVDLCSHQQKEAQTSPKGPERLLRVHRRSRDIGDLSFPGKLAWPGFFQNSCSQHKILLDFCCNLGFLSRSLHDWSCLTKTEISALAFIWTLNNSNQWGKRHHCTSWDLLSN